MRSSNRGFSIIQVLTALAIGSVVMFGLITMNVNSMKATRSIEINNQVSDTISLLKIQLSSDQICTSRFLANFPTDGRLFPLVNIPSKVISVPKIDDPNGATYLSLNSPIPGINGSQLISLEVRNLKDIGSSGGQGLSGDVVLKISKGANIIGAQEVTRSFPIYFKTSVSGADISINSCSVGNAGISLADLSVMCASIGGNWNSSTASCEMSSLMAKMCQSLGGSWDGSQCKNITNTAPVAAPPAAAPAPSVCATGSVTVPAAQCSPPFAAIQCNYVWNWQDQNEQITFTGNGPALNTATASPSTVYANGMMTATAVLVCSNGTWTFQSCSCQMNM